MDTGFTGNRRVVLEKIDSTNEEAGRLAKSGARHGTVVLAKEQTAGRGRRGRSWYSPPGTSIYMSLLLRPAIVPGQASMLTLVAALAVNGAIEEQCGLTPMIKWPNDLLLKEKKVCGILTEMSLNKDAVDYVIVGIGVNVSQSEFPEDIRGMATSLEKESGSSVDREGLIEAILKHMDGCYARFLAAGDLSGLQQEYNERLINRGRPVRVLDAQGELSGEALGIDPAGELLIRQEDGEVKSVCAGEVSVRGIYGYI